VAINVKTGMPPFGILGNHKIKMCHNSMKKIMIQKITENNWNFWTVNLIMRAKKLLTSRQIFRYAVPARTVTKKHWLQGSLIRIKSDFLAGLHASLGSLQRCGAVENAIINQKPDYNFRSAFDSSATISTIMNAPHAAMQRSMPACRLTVMPTTCRRTEKQ